MKKREESLEKALEEEQTLKRNESQNSSKHFVTQKIAEAKQVKEEKTVIAQEKPINSKFEMKPIAFQDKEDKHSKDKKDAFEFNLDSGSDGDREVDRKPNEHSNTSLKELHEATKPQNESLNKFEKDTSEVKNESVQEKKSLVEPKHVVKEPKPDPDSDNYSDDNIQDEYGDHQSEKRGWACSK